MQFSKLSAVAALPLIGAAALYSTYAHTQSLGPTGASDKVSVGTASILAAPVASVAGSVQGEPAIGSVLAAAGSRYVVTGIGQASGEAVDIIIESADGAVTASVNLAKFAVEKLGVSVGTALTVARVSAGTALIASGKVLAFIPNTLGESLLYRERVPE